MNSLTCALKQLGIYYTPPAALDAIRKVSTGSTRRPAQPVVSNPPFGKRPRKHTQETGE